jgi:predicted Rossmann fold nucleotide-binding protein DprA/Smf involved in DNA uptake
MRLKPELQPGFKAGRLLIVSPFPPKQRRITADLAEERNRFVAAVASVVFVAHAAPASRTFALCDELSRQNKRVITIDDPTNGNLLAQRVPNLIESEASPQWRSRWLSADSPPRDMARNTNFLPY